MSRLLIYALVVASCVMPTASFAWGLEGHRIIARIAAAELTPAARRQVIALLGGRDVANVMEENSTWADDVAHTQTETARWHFVDIPIGSSGYDAARDCPRADCVVGQITRDETILADKGERVDARAQALRFLIHFVGDIHQPLHAANHDDRGGNRIRVSLYGHRTNLHAVWDNDVVRAMGNDPERLAAALERAVAPADRARWVKGGPVDWANESFAIASREIYAAPDIRGRENLRLRDDYPESERPFVAVQIEKAGVRLAAALNRILR